MANENGVVSAAGFPNQGPIDRSAAGLQYNSFLGGTKAEGAALGKARQFVFTAPVSFNPNRSMMSGGQFGNGHAKSIVGEGEDEYEEED